MNHEKIDHGLAVDTPLTSLEVITSLRTLRIPDPTHTEENPVAQAG